MTYNLSNPTCVNVPAAQHSGNGRRRRGRWLPDGRLPVDG